jgi:hypothetical protein
MQLEAQEKLTQAAEYYEHVLSEDQTNLVASLATWANIRWCGNAESPFFDR